MERLTSVAFGRDQGVVVHQLLIELHTNGLVAPPHDGGAQRAAGFGFDDDGRQARKLCDAVDQRTAERDVADASIEERSVDFDRAGHI